MFGVFTFPVTTIDHERINVRIPNEQLHCLSQLADIVRALNAPCFFFGAGKSQEQQSRQNSDDGNNNQQFNQGKAVSTVSSHIDWTDALLSCHERLMPE